MAKATTRVETRTEKVPATYKTVEEKQISLVLSPEEANALKGLLDHVGGSPTRSRRGLTDGIYDALSAVGVHDLGSDAKGSVIFDETEAQRPLGTVTYPGGMVKLNVTSPFNRIYENARVW